MYVRQNAIFYAWCQNFALLLLFVLRLDFFTGLMFVWFLLARSASAAEDIAAARANPDNEEEPKIVISDDATGRRTRFKIMLRFFLLLLI